MLPVILFHAGLANFSGGFVGVGVFLFISGDLITSIVLGELAEDKFSLMRFYVGRALEILSALFVVTLATTLTPWFIGAHTVNVRWLIVELNRLLSEQAKSLADAVQ